MMEVEIDGKVYVASEQEGNTCNGCVGDDGLGYDSLCYKLPHGCSYDKIIWIKKEEGGREMKETEITTYEVAITPAGGLVRFQAMVDGKLLRTPLMTTVEANMQRHLWLNGRCNYFPDTHITKATSFFFGSEL